MRSCSRCIPSPYTCASSGSPSKTDPIHALLTHRQTAEPWYPAPEIREPVGRPFHGPQVRSPTARVIRARTLTANHALRSYLSAPEDIARLVRGIRLILRISKEAPLPARLDLADASPMLDSALDAQSDAALADLVRARVETLYHPTSTARMAPRAAGGVVDAKLRVYGIGGLRVCDASIFPEIVSGHTVRSMALLCTSWIGYC